MGHAWEKEKTEGKRKRHMEKGKEHEEHTPISYTPLAIWQACTSLQGSSLGLGFIKW